MEGGGGDWTDLAEDRDTWRAVEKTVTNLRIPLNAGEFLYHLRNY